MGLFPINPYEVTDQPMGEPDPDQCQLGISPLCTEEGAYLWQGQYVCAHCFSMAEHENEQSQAHCEAKRHAQLEAQR